MKPYYDRDGVGKQVTVTVKRLSSGYFHIRGIGPCNWAQPKCWPCDEASLRQSAHPEASEEFFRAAMRLAAASKPT